MSFGVFTGEREMLGAVLGNQWGSWGLKPSIDPLKGAVP